MHRLFGTYEVLEQVLMYLDHISLRKARVVNSLWQSIIEQHPRLRTNYRQRLRLRELRILLLGTDRASKLAVVEKWCYSADAARKAYDPKFQNAFVKLPQADGENWMASVDHSYGEAGLDGVWHELRSRSKLLFGAYVLVYDVTSRSSFEDVMTWWMSGQLPLRFYPKGIGGDEQHCQYALSADTERVCFLEAAPRVERLVDTMQHLLYRGQVEEDRKVRRRARGFSAHENPVLLALVAVKMDVFPGTRKVRESEGRALAAKMAVPFFEIDPKSDDPEVGGSVPLRGFWRSYRERWMEERAGWQNQDRGYGVFCEEVKGDSIAPKDKGSESEVRAGSTWWRRLSKLPWQ